MNADQKSDLRNIAMSDVRENPVALRGNDKENVKYKELRDSIANKGILSVITAREKQDPDGTVFYEVVDGLQRYSCAKDLGFTTIGVKVISGSDADVLEAQIVTNLCRVDTPAVAYTKALQRMLVMNPTMTLGELGEKISQSGSWISGRLNLLKLDPKIQESVDAGDINVSNAQALSKLPKEEQFNFLQQAMELVPGEFLPVVQNRVKELRDAAKTGQAPGEAQFVANPHLRGKKDLESELANPKDGPAMCASLGLTTAAQGFAAAIRYVLSLDAASVEVQKAKYDARKAEKDATKQKNEIERSEKKAKEATDKAAAVKAAAGVTV